MLWRGLEPTSKNTGPDGPAFESGNRGGNQAPNSDRFQHFTTLLKAAGFSPGQLLKISDAMQEAVLAVAPNAIPHTDRA